MFGFSLLPGQVLDFAQGPFFLMPPWRLKESVCIPDTATILVALQTTWLTHPEKQERQGKDGSLPDWLPLMVERELRNDEGYNTLNASTCCL